jgi:hypothetical protein
MCCASCGAKQDDSAKFCIDCGAKVRTSANQPTVGPEIMPRQTVVERPQISRPQMQPPPQKPGGTPSFVLGGVLVALFAAVVIIYLYERSQSGAPQQAAATPNATPAPSTALVVAQPATPVEAAWMPYLKDAPCMASNGSLMQTFINNGVLPTAQDAASALAACQ